MSVLNFEFLFQEIYRAGIRLDVADARLLVKGKISPELKEAITQHRHALLRQVIQSTPFQDRPQSFWANLKLALWERYGSRLFLDATCQDLLQAWSYVNQAVLWWKEA